MGAVCVISSVSAQQYVSQGPVPQRPTGFPGAIPAEPAQTVRIRPRQRASQEQTNIPSRTQNVQLARTQEAQPVRTRARLVPVARSRNIVQEEAQSARSRIAAGDVDEVYVKPQPRALVQNPVATQPPQPQTTRFVTPKPVIEEEEEEGDYISEEVEDEQSGSTPATNSISRSAYVGPFQPNLSQAPLQAARPLQQPIQSPLAFQRPAYLQPTAFRPSQQQSPQPLPNSQPLGLVKQQPRPQPPQQQRPLSPSPLVTRPPPSPTPVYNSLSEEEEEDEAQYVRQPPARQQVRRPQSSEDNYRPQQNKPQQPPRQQQLTRNQDTSRPYPSKASVVPKDRKPVIQNIRKYQDENEDGSITWGYENDDGSFKEETIGVDCVTRGKYGYVDPDGVKREYSYQTGIPCDRSAEAEQAATSNEGYVDYTNNKYVLANGQEIDLDDMVKNRARKPPGSRYRQ